LPPILAAGLTGSDRQSLSAFTSGAVTRLHPGGLEVRDLGYRWGSLGKGGRLNIHWAAMQLPVSLLDYVIVHELAHIGQLRHTATFWAAVDRAMPGYEHRKTRLAAAGTILWLG
jgi:predicted metal-dependent hydrolase